MSLISQNNTSMLVITFPWFCCMKTLHGGQWKTPILEGPYVEFCNSVWPLLYTIGKVSKSDKNFQKTPKSENSQKYPKNDIFYVYASFLKETRVFHLLYASCSTWYSRIPSICDYFHCNPQIICDYCYCNLHMSLEYATVIFETRVFFL